MSINKINNKMKIEKGKRIYETIIKKIETGEILYQEKSFGGLVCTIEKILSFNNGIIEGNHQLIGWGHPVLQFYALERLQEFLKGQDKEFIKAIIEAGKSGDIEILKRWNNDKNPDNNI